ncbi:MAG: tRNA pseudouridine(38-40) synthase TruA [Candidatus Helarchaeota archaeon]
MRIACKVFYLGDNYRGFQLQPNVETIEGKIRAALKKAMLIDDEMDSSIQGASRTDALVHALGNVIAFNTEKRVIIPQVNHYLPNDIIIWAKKEVNDSFSPRFEAIKRHYKYITRYRGENINEMELEAKNFIGTHDFKNFSKKGDNKNTIREIFEIKITQENDFLIFDVIGKAFLYQMVRRMIKILLEVGKGSITEKKVKFHLVNEIEASKRISPAPLKNEGALILWDVIYPFEFEIDQYSFKKLQNSIYSLFQYHSLRLETINFFKKFLKI